MIFYINITVQNIHFKIYSADHAGKGRKNRKINTYSKIFETFYYVIFLFIRFQNIFTNNHLKKYIFLFTCGESKSILYWINHLPGCKIACSHFGKSPESCRQSGEPMIWWWLSVFLNEYVIKLQDREKWLI